MRRAFAGISLLVVASVAGVCAYSIWSHLRDSPTANADAAIRPVLGAGENGAAAAKSKLAEAAKSLMKAKPLPPGDTPLKDAFPELQARADAGELAAAKRLYLDTDLCSRFHGIDVANSRTTGELLDANVDGMDDEQMSDFQVQLAAAQSNKQVIEKFHRLCDGVSDAMFDATLPNLRKAAQLGDESARACYLQRGPNYDPRRLVNHPEWLDAYRAGAATMIDSGIAAGDWKVVDVVRTSLQPDSRGPLAGVLGSDPYQYYRYLKLYRLGAETYRIDQVEQMLSAAAAELSPAQLADADTWAQTTFQQDFNGSNSTESTVSGWDPCAFAHEPL